MKPLGSRGFAPSVPERRCRRQERFVAFMEVQGAKLPAGGAGVSPEIVSFPLSRPAGEGNKGGEGMGLLDLLTLPVLVPVQGVHWLAEKLAEEAERELYDEERVRGQLLELQTRYEQGEMAEEEYDQQERALLERLNAIREAKR